MAINKQNVTNKCSLCAYEDHINDFSKNFKFHYIEENDKIVSLRYLCDDCAREIVTLMILWANNISKILLKKLQEK